MNILIIGSGALGCLFGALLAPHAEVTLYCRQIAAARIARIRGINLLDAKGRQIRTERVQTINDLNDAPKKYFDYALVCVKAGGGRDAGLIARELLKPEGLALTLQNGLGNRERIGEALGMERVMVGITAQAATLVDTAAVRHAGEGETVIAPVGNQQRLHAITLTTLFNEAGIDTALDDDPETLLWSKLVINAGINALAAVLRVPNGVLAEVPECQDIMAATAREAAQVAEALGIRLPYDDPAAKTLEVCGLTAANHASTLQDILRGRPTEIDVINGAVAELGARHGVPTPVNTLLTQLVFALEATSGDRIA